jgi:hypothetical protein
MSRLLLLIFLLPFSHPQAQPAPMKKPPANVGDISFDPAIDDTSFHLHDSTHVWQYYNSAAYWLDHKDSITRFIRSRYHPPVDPANPADPANATDAANAANQDGWLTIRFIINTEGRTGRFRLFEMDSTYQPIQFDPRISGALLAAIRDWPGWTPAHYKELRFDTYQYLTFRLRRGRITTISP